MMALRIGRYSLLVFLCSVSALFAEAFDAWAPSTVDADWQFVSKLQRVPLFDETTPDSLDLGKLLAHQSPVVRLAAASTIIQTKQEDLYDDVLELCRDDWPFVANTAFSFVFRMDDEDRMRRLMKAGSFPDWACGNRSQPYRTIFHAAGLSSSSPSSYWQWHGNAEVAEYRAAPPKEQTDQCECLWVLSLDRSVVKQGGTIECGMRHKGMHRYDTRIHGFQAALEVGNKTKTRDQPSHWPRMHEVQRTLKDGYVVATYRISIPPDCKIGDYCLSQERGHTCFRVVRSEATEEELASLVKSDDVKDLFKAAELRSPLAIDRLKQGLDRLPSYTHESQHKDVVPGYWSALGSIGTERCAEILLLDNHEYDCDCMAFGSRSGLGMIGSAARRPAIRILRNWKDHDGETLARAFSVLGPNALKNEHALLKELVTGSTKLISQETREVERLNIQIAKMGAKEDPEKPSPAFAELLAKYQDIQQGRQHGRRIESVIAALSMLREDECEFVLASLLEFAEIPASIAVAGDSTMLRLVIPRAFVRADAPWVVQRLWEQTHSHPNGAKIKQALEGLGSYYFSGAVWKDQSARRVSE